MDQRKLNLQEAAALSERPKNPNEGLCLLPTSSPPRAPTSSPQLCPKPNCMSQLGGVAGAAASGGGTQRTTGSFFQTPNCPLSMNVVDQTHDQTNPLSSISALASPGGGSGSGSSARIDVGEVRCDRKLDLSMDPKKLKRVISNRLSAQRSRVKKLEHVADMEKQVQDLETQIAALSPQVTFYRNQKCYPEMEQKESKERIVACANGQILVDGEIEANKAEQIRLSQLQMTQQQEKMEAQATMAAWEPAGMNQQMENLGDLNQREAGLGLFYVDPNQDDVGDSIADTNALKQLSLKQQMDKPGHEIPMAGWEPGQGQLPNLGLNQSGLQQQQLQNPSSSRPRHRRSLSLIPDFEGIEHILNIDPGNPNP